MNRHIAEQRLKNRSFTNTGRHVKCQMPRIAMKRIRVSYVTTQPTYVVMRKTEKALLESKYMASI
jgi:hypothetical protein